MLLVCLILPLLSVGCGERPRTLAECRFASEAICKEGQDAQQARKPREAADAAARGKRVAEIAGKLLPAAPSEAETADYACVRKASRRAQHYANLAEEDRLYGDLTGGWRAAAYRATRRATLSTVFKGLAAAARQMAKGDSPETNPALRATADTGAALVQFLSQAKGGATSPPDWVATASQLDSYAAAPPAEASLVLAVAWAASGQGVFALCEFESIQPEALQSVELRALLPLSHAIALSINRMPNRGVRALEQSMDGSDEGAAAKSLCLAHILMALYAVSERDMEEADLHAARSLQAWPANPIAEFLTGEKLLADGQRGMAVDSLEKAAAGSRYDWAAKRLARRAREIREGDTSRPLFQDSGLIRDFVLASMHGAYTSESAATRLFAVADRFLKEMGSGSKPVPE